MKLYNAMFDTYVLRKIFGTMFKVLATLGIYSLILVFIFSTQTLTGGQNIGGIVVTLLIIYFSFYGLFIFLPFYLFLKYSYESPSYLRPLASLYGVTLPVLQIPTLKKKERRKIAFYLFSAALFLFVITVLSISDAPFLIVIGLIPFYVMIYKNWINGLSFGLGESFDDYYKAHKYQYILRGIGFIFLMHIPLFWFFQPWVLQALSEHYFKHMEVKHHEI